MPVIARVRPIHIGLLYSLEVCPTKKLRKSSWHGLLLPHSQCEAHTHTYTLHHFTEYIEWNCAFGRSWDLGHSFPSWIGWHLREFASYLQKALVCNFWWFISHWWYSVGWKQSPAASMECHEPPGGTWLWFGAAGGPFHRPWFDIPLLYIVAGNRFFMFLFSLLPFIRKWSGPTVSYHYISFITYPFWLTYVFNVYIWCEAVWCKHAVTSIHACELH